MKAFLLAGGLGSRLRPFTDHTPKCLVEIGEVPLLAIWLDLCARHGITEVLINITRHIERVQRFLEAEPRAVRVTLVEEPVLRGSAGSVFDHRGFVDGESSFFILHADNLTNANLRRLAAAHATHNDPVTLGLFRAPRPREAGVVELDADGIVRSFEEKPQEPRSDLANAGVYVARPSFFEHLPVRGGVVDFGHDVLPSLIGRVRGVEIDGFLVDVGTPEGLARGREHWRELGAAGALA